MVTDEYQLIEFFGPLNSDLSILVRHIPDSELHVLHILAGADKETNQRLTDAISSLPPELAGYYIATQSHRKIPVIITHPLPGSITAREWLQPYLPPPPFPKIQHMVHHIGAGYLSNPEDVHTPAPVNHRPSANDPSPGQVPTAEMVPAKNPTGEFTRLLRAAGLAEGQGGTPGQQNVPVTPQVTTPASNRAQVFPVPHISEPPVTDVVLESYPESRQDGPTGGRPDFRTPKAEPIPPSQKQQEPGEFTRFLRSSGAQGQSASARHGNPQLDSLLTSPGPVRSPATPEKLEPGGFTQMMEGNYQASTPSAWSDPGSNDPLMFPDESQAANSQATKIFIPTAGRRAEPTPAHAQSSPRPGDYTQTILSRPQALPAETGTDEASPTRQRSFALIWIIAAIVIIALGTILVFVKFM